MWYQSDTDEQQRRLKELDGAIADLILLRSACARRKLIPWDSALEEIRTALDRIDGINE